MDTVAVAEPAEPAAMDRSVEYVPAVIEPRLTVSETVRVDLPGTDPEVAPSDSQPAFSFAVHDSDASPVFVNVRDPVVSVFPRSTWSGETSSSAGDVLVEEGTVIETETVAEPDPLSPETVTVVVYVPAFSDPRSAVREIERVSFPQTVPEVEFSESQLDFSLADHEKALLVVFVSVSDAVLSVLPKSTWTGDTYIFTGLPGSEETSTGEEELQACVTARKNREDAMNGTRMSVGCTASLRESRFAGRRRSGGQRLPDELSSW